MTNMWEHKYNASNRQGPNDFAMINKRHCDKQRPDTQNTAVFIDD